MYTTVAGLKYSDIVNFSDTCMLDYNELCFNFISLGPYLFTEDPLVLLCRPLRMYFCRIKKEIPRVYSPGQEMKVHLSLK